MTTHHMAFALGYLGAGFGVVMIVPQVIRVLRYPTKTGVSALSWSVTAVSCLAWLTYGIRTASAPQIPGNILLVIGASAVVLLVPGRRSRGHRAALLTAAAVVVLALAWSLSPAATGYLAFAIGLFSGLPQVYESIGNWKARLTSGVSITTWTLRTTSQICWLAYGVLATDVPVIVGASVGLASATTLVALERTARLASRAQTTAASAGAA